MQRIKKILLGIFLAGAIFMQAGTAHAYLGLDLNATGPYENGGPATFESDGKYTTVGWAFTANTDLLLNRLGVLDADVERRHSEEHYVGIWAAGNQQGPLASVTIPEGVNNVPETSPHGARFHFENLTNPLLLKAGTTYFVGATLYAGVVNGGSSSSDFDAFASLDQNYPPNPVYVSGYITYLHNAYGISDTTNVLVFPSEIYSSADYTIGADIDVTPVPVPGALLLLGSGLMSLLGMRRRLV